MYRNMINFNKPTALLLISSLIFLSCKGTSQSDSYFDFDAPLLETELILSIGDSPEHQIGDFYEFQIDSKGRIFIPDDALHLIHVFDNDGQLLRTIGREGRGPGEFESVVLTIGSRDELLIFDWQLRRVQQFEEAANSWEVTNTLDIKQEGMAFPVRVIAVDDNSFFVEYVNAHSSNPDAGEAFPFVRLKNHEGTTLIDNVATFSKNDALVVRTPNSVSVRPHPFGSETHIYYTGNTLYHVWGGAMNVLKTSLNGNEAKTDTLFSIRSPQVPVTSIDWQKIFDKYDYEDEFRRAARESEVITKSQVAGIAVDDVNRVWLKRNVDEGSPIWSVFTKNGRLLYNVELPKEFRIMEVRNNLIYGINKDEFDVAEVQVYRISQ